MAKSGYQPASGTELDQNQKRLLLKISITNWDIV